ncbi:unnamed protein product [Urochloa decumbens]|uniref:F-box domain-containing protein n=1 Tax=Urochloa decumbens TaxID=240449 RepID=A0ABC9DN58_9POAL
MEAKKAKHGGGGVSLPEDVIFDVLSWLPVRSLCRFRCVCKAWRALISYDPAFAAAQKSRAAPLLAGVFLSPDRLVRRVALDGSSSWEQHGLELRVMDMGGDVLRVVELEGAVEGALVPACLDLVCVDGGAAAARLIDPATRRAVTVAGGRGRYHRFGRALSGAYKVVGCSGFNSWDRHDRRRLEITTLAPGAGAREPTSWRQVPPPQPAVFTCSCHGCTASVNGVLHFLTGHPFAPTWRSHVARLDLETEEWMTTVKAPATEWPKEGERWEITIGELKGTLSMVETVRSHLDGTACTNIWLLVDPEKGVWVKEYTMPMPRTVSLVEALEVLGDGTVLLLSTFEIEGEGKYSYLFEGEKTCVLQLYDPGTRVCKDLVKMAGNRFCGKTMTLYTGSLLSRPTNNPGQFSC